MFSNYLFSGSANSSHAIISRRSALALFKLGLLASLLAFSLLVPANPTNAGSPPYPASPVITDLQWEFIDDAAEGSDNWPITWGDDGHLYTAYGDGWGFEPFIDEKLSLGFARVEGPGDDFQGFNIRSPSGEQTGGGRSGKKASGMLMVDGTLYMWVRNANNSGEQCQLAWSEDRAVTWTWNDWKFAELGYCAFLNFGQNYAGARDDYVYMYSPDTPDAYEETDHVVLTRVHKGQIADRSAYQFFRGLDSTGNPQWTSDIEQRKPVFTFKGGSNRLDVTYNAPLGRYLMTMRSRARAGGVRQFSIYDAPEPWGPWTTVYYVESGNGFGESAHIPSKWISGDGQTFYLVSARNDSFHVRRATLTVDLLDDPPPLETLTVTFSVHLQGRPDPPDESWVLDFDVRLLLDGSLLDPVEVPTDQNGVFTLDVAPGTYDIWVKGANTLARERLQVDLLESPAEPIDLGIQMAGDYNGDNKVDMGDYVFLIENFFVWTDELEGDLQFLDFNGDGVVDMGDYVILIENFFTQGAPPP